MIDSSRYNHLLGACKASTSITLFKETFMKTDSQRLVAKAFAMHASQLSNITARHNQDDHRQFNTKAQQKVVSQKKSLKLIAHLCQSAILLTSKSILKVSHTQALKRQLQDPQVSRFKILTTSCILVKMTCSGELPKVT